MSFRGDSSADEDISYRKTKKPFRRPILLKNIWRRKSEDSQGKKSAEILDKKESKHSLKIGENTAGTVENRNRILKSYIECYSCKKPIYKDFEESVLAGGDRNFHMDCFICFKCTKGLNLANFHEVHGIYYCEEDYKEAFLPKCFICTKYIHEEPIKFSQRNYHPFCFTCKKCSQPACPFTFHEKNGAIYDEFCYHHLFSPKCFNCLKPIKDSSEMTVALGTTFHRNHFVCFHCAIPLPSHNFRQKDGELYCENDYHQLFTIKCDQCHDPIIHRGIKALGKNFHAECCLRCEKCKKILDERKYLEEGRKVYCRKDWLELFGPRCGASDCLRPVAEVLTGSAVVALGKDWHPTCFVCHQCNRMLEESSFYELEKEPYCYPCYHDITCIDCLKIKDEREKQRQKIIPLTRTSSTRRSMSPIALLRPASASK